MVSKCHFALYLGTDTILKNTRKCFFTGKKNKYLFIWRNIHTNKKNPGRSQQKWGEIAAGAEISSWKQSNWGWGYPDEHFLLFVTWEKFKVIIIKTRTNKNLFTVTSWMKENSFISVSQYIFQELGWCLRGRWV